MKSARAEGGGGSQHYEVPLLQEHFERIGRRLAAEGEAAISFDQGTNRGQIREAFIRELLSHNTSPLTGIGTGEIIHPGSRTDQRRRQLDVVIHNNRYPKISMATGIDLFFIETVSSFVEIKSRLRKDHIRQAALVAKEIKAHVQLDGQHFNPNGMVDNPRPYSFVFAYDGPANIETLLSWMKEISSEDDYGLDRLRSTDGSRREYFNHLFVDGVFVLGKGFVCLDSLPFESRLQAASRHNPSDDPRPHLGVCDRQRAHSFVDVDQRTRRELPLEQHRVWQLPWDPELRPIAVNPRFGSQVWQPRQLRRWNIPHSTLGPCVDVAHRVPVPPSGYAQSRRAAKAAEA